MFGTSYKIEFMYVILLWAKMTTIKNESLHLAVASAADFIKGLPDGLLQCVICDPPFGIGEASFDKHYARAAGNVISGYAAAPEGAAEYAAWAKTWISELPRVIKPDGTVYIVCAWNHLCDIELCLRAAGLTVFNHIIWKYNFGVYTQNKFVTSHYHILRCGKGTPKFYSRAYFNETDKLADGGSAQYGDMEDVWTIKKEYSPGTQKNVNKLPDKLVEKMLFYASAPGDWIGDFFMGNFTTAYVGRRSGRRVVGCDINKAVYDTHADAVSALAFDLGAAPVEKTSTKPENAGKKITEADRLALLARYDVLKKDKTKKDSMAVLTVEFKRGHFSILNILKAAGR
jgi:site-specific DNA-methyltransferase (adenine-specific)